MYFCVNYFFNRAFILSICKKNNVCALNWIVAYLFSYNSRCKILENVNSLHDVHLNANGCQTDPWDSKRLSCASQNAEWDENELKGSHHTHINTIMTHNSTSEETDRDSKKEEERHRWEEPYRSRLHCHSQNRERSSVKLRMMNGKIQLNRFCVCDERTISREHCAETVCHKKRLPNTVFCFLHTLTNDTKNFSPVWDVEWHVELKCWFRSNTIQRPQILQRKQAYIHF